MPELSSIAIAISGAALLISLITMWVTLFRRGSLKMTQPTTVMFGPDGEHHDGPPKVYMRFLLYSTSKRGQVLENLFVRLARGEHQQNFPIWVLGDEKLSRGSGIFVGEQGVVANHHFLLPPDADKYVFRAGAYRLEVHSRVVGEPKTTCLWSACLQVSEGDAASLAQTNKGLYFDWGPDSNRYISIVKSKQPGRLPRELIEMFENGLPKPAPIDGSTNQ